VTTDLEILQDIPSGARLATAPEASFFLTNPDSSATQCKLLAHELDNEPLWNGEDEDDAD